MDYPTEVVNAKNSEVLVTEHSFVSDNNKAVVVIVSKIFVEDFD